MNGILVCTLYFIVITKLVMLTVKTHDAYVLQTKDLLLFCYTQYVETLLKFIANKTHFLCIF